MDYRNADGTVAEMCGNGLRVFASYLIEEGLVSGPPDPGFRSLPGRVPGPCGSRMTASSLSTWVRRRCSVTARSRRAVATYTGLAISVGNPHLACIVDRPVSEIELGHPRVLAPAGLTSGANIEIVRAIAPREIEMRVNERGSGLTLSCGTGAVAATVAAAAAAGEWPDGPSVPWTVWVPGGRLTVLPSSTASQLTGPAEIVAAGELSAAWLADISPLGLAIS